jgi:hypothetical protein
MWERARYIRTLPKNVWVLEQGAASKGAIEKRKRKEERWEPKRKGTFGACKQSRRGREYSLTAKRSGY